MTSGDENRFEQLLQRVQSGSKLLRCTPLIGGISAQVTLLETEAHGGRQEKLVMRRHGAVDRRFNPQVASHEFRLLQRLYAAGMAVPRPVFLDESCDLFPEQVVVLEYVGGTMGMPADSEADPLEAFVDFLARLHSLDIALLELTFLPHMETKVTRKLRELADREGEQTEEVWQIGEALLSIPRLPERTNPIALIHNDYWWGNTLWKDGELVAVIDWEDAVLADPLADLANSRLEVLWTLGQEGMERFTRRYQELAPQIDLTNLPFWDLFNALRPAQNMHNWALGEREPTMRATLREFILQALPKLPQTL